VIYFIIININDTDGQFMAAILLRINAKISVKMHKKWQVNVPIANYIAITNNDYYYYNDVCKTTNKLQIYSKFNSFCSCEILIEICKSSCVLKPSEWCP